MAIFAVQVRTFYEFRFFFCVDALYLGSGPKRYDYTESDGSWRYSRDNKPLDDLLNEELGRTFDKPIRLSLSSSS